MTRFNYLGSARRSLVDRLRDIEISPATRNALFGLTAIVAICAAVTFFERQRLAAAQEQQFSAIQRGRSSDAAMNSARAEAKQMQQMYALAKTVVAIQASGAAHAALIAEIGDRLPATVWVKEISGDAGGLTVTGEAKDYTSLSDALSSLDHARMVGSPTLREAQRQGDGRSEALIAYALHVEERRP